MNAKTFLVGSLLVCIALALAACGPARGVGLGGAIPGSGNLKSETRDPGPFESIAVEYPADVTVQQGADDIVEIQAEDNLLPQISTQVISGTLIIKTDVDDWKARVNPSKPVRVAITAKNLKQIALSAPVGTMEMEGWQADALKLVLDGGAQARLNGIQVDLLESVLSGAGDIQVTGTAQEMKLLLSGLGNFDGSGLQSTRATIELSGMGNATVRVDDELVAKITGAGSIKYFGSPRVQQSVSGAGSVKPAE